MEYRRGRITREYRLASERGLHDQPCPSARDGLPRDTGALSSYKNVRVEPADHGIGRSNSGLSTKIHQLVDGRGRPVCYDVAGYMGRNVIERGCNDTNSPCQAAFGAIRLRSLTSAVRAKFLTCQQQMAEGEGFEPPGPWRGLRFSRPLRSTAPASLRARLRISRPQHRWRLSGRAGNQLVSQVGKADDVGLGEQNRPALRDDLQDPHVVLGECGDQHQRDVPEPR
jgi:hypothetical protein